MTSGQFINRLRAKNNLHGLTGGDAMMVKEGLVNRQYSSPRNILRPAVAVAFRVAAVLLVVALCSGESWAAEMESRFSPITKFWFYVFNFSTFLAIVVAIYKKKIVALLEARHGRYQDQVSRAALEVRGLEARHSALVERLSNIDDENEKMLTQFEEETTRIEDNLVKRASAEAHTLRQNMAARIRDEQRVAKKEIETEIFKRAVEQSKHEVVRLLRASADVERKLREDIIAAFVDS